MSDFSKRLRALRLNKKISQRQLSKILHFGYTAVSNYENGQREPSIDTLIQIADYLNVSIDYLVGRQNSQEYEMCYKLEAIFKKLSRKNQKYLFLFARYVEKKNTADRSNGSKKEDI